MGPRSSSWKVINARFYHFPDGSAGLGACALGDMFEGAWTYRTEQLHFDDATVPKRTDWSIPDNHIIHDLDGSLTTYTSSIASNDDDRRALSTTTYGEDAYITPY